MVITLTEITQVDTANKYIYTDEKGRSKLDIAKLITDLLAEFTFKTYKETEEILIYNDGVYQLGGEICIKEECQRRIGVSAVLTTYAVNEIIGHIRRSTYVSREAFNREKVIINVQNGLLHTFTWELSPHTPDFLSTVRIPVKFNPAAQARLALKFFREVHHPEDIPIIQELFGNCLIFDNSFQKAFLYVGDGENGKSTELNLLKTFIGQDNCTNVSWQSLEMNRFAKSALENKLINTFADLPSQGMNMTTAFKMLTGGDPIGTEKKFKDQYSFINYAKLIFSANKPPKISDEDSYAFWRRWIIINFPNQFPDGKKDPRLLEKITTGEELSGLLNFGLAGLARLRKQQKYSYAKTVEATTDFYMRAADPVYAFLQDRCVAEPDPDYFEDKEEFYAAFIQYCLDNKLPTLKPNAFARSLQNQTIIRVRPFRPSVEKEGKKVRLQAWQGVKLREKDDNDGL
jgi:putative DNA primase/helicase